ncbi:MAG: hypothetical protein JNJ43_11655 [Anaerolineales bacterium]|nr:hypothetical protein [Anaerolineales bacterium]
MITLALTISAFVLFGVWFLIDMSLFDRYEGKIKRGIKVWSRELDTKSWKYLSSLRQDTVEEKEFLFLKFKQSFIRKHDGEVLILARPESFTSTWVCTGYVDLNSPTREIQYRMAITGLILLIVFNVLGVLFFVLSFYPYKNAIDAYLERKASGNV